MAQWWSGAPATRRARVRFLAGGPIVALFFAAVPGLVLNRIYFCSEKTISQYLNLSKLSKMSEINLI